MPMSEDETIPATKDAADAPDATPTGEPRPEAALDPSQPGDTVAQAILLRQLDTLQACEAGVALNADPECLHDFRIAVRRSRSALSQIKGVFDEPTLRRHAPRLRWLGQITSAPRDLDVYLLDFDRLKASLPEPYQDDLEPLRGALRQRAELAHAELTAHLRSPQYHELLADWRAFLTQPNPQHAATNAQTPVKTLADARIWKLFRRTLKQGRAIADDSPAENLHDLRKTCKKLRYLLEFFRSLYPEEAITPSIKQLKKLQDYLGEFQDTHARIDLLGHLAETLRIDPQIPTKTLLATGMLLAALDNRQAQLRTEFPKRFGRFDDAHNRVRFRELFKPNRVAADAP